MELTLRGVWVLLLTIWMKFCVLWRLFRMFSLCLKVDCIENLVRCGTTANSIEQLWKTWHVSFNAFNIKYAYIPLGGKKMGPVKATMVIFGIFLFIAIWHDAEIKLVLWGVGNGFFVVFEKIFSSTQNKS